MAGPAALYMGTCSGHGTGSGSVHHPGLGGGTLPGCIVPTSATDTKIVPKSVALMNATTLWAPTPQRSATELARTVRINNIGPILDQDILIPHPTTTMHTVNYTGIPKVCPGTTPPGIPNNAWWCTIGTAGGREPAVGHSRKLFATVKTVFINGRRAGTFGDPFGDFSVAFPCTSVVTGSSPNVFIGLIRG
tara:strand:+ start:72 stop:644 length:573 start_codon:yes stop_codon:yes gene_type:complete